MPVYVSTMYDILGPYLYKVDMFCDAGSGPDVCRNLLATVLMLSIVLKTTSSFPRSKEICRQHHKICNSSANRPRFFAWDGCLLRSLFIASQDIRAGE